MPSIVKPSYITHIADVKPNEPACAGAPIRLRGGLNDGASEQRVVEFVGSPNFRVVCLSSGSVIELADGKDALGNTRWIKALIIPDRRNLGEVVYEGWKEISQALGVHVETAMLWARLKEYRLPVRHGVKGPYILASLLRAWLTDRTYAASKASRKTGRKPTSA